MDSFPLLDGSLSTAPEALTAAAGDFGHLIRRTPQAVLRPGSAQDIATMVRWASDHGVRIAARGQGHSVYGRSQVPGGIVIDMSSLAKVRVVDRAQVVVDAGTTWRSVLARTRPLGLTPPVLTNYLDLSVGGTLSVGGIGGTSHRYGTLTDNVLELEVVTGDGRILVCSPSENSDLFDAVRAGLGQFGIITRATVALTSAPDRARRYTLAYPDLESLAADQRCLLRDGRADHLQGAVAPGGEPWAYQLEAVVFHRPGEPPADEYVLSGLIDDRSRAQIEDLSFGEHLRSFDRYTALLRSTGEWSYRSPWLLSFLPGSTAEQTALEMLRDLAPVDLGTHGVVLFYPLRADRITTPLVRLPSEDVVFAFNLIRFTPPAAVDPVDLNLRLYREIRARGGVLYPVSAMPLSGADWQEHFGPVWQDVQQAKKRFDPLGVLTPGYELFEKEVGLGPPQTGTGPH